MFVDREFMVRHSGLFSICVGLALIGMGIITGITQARLANLIMISHNNHDLHATVFLGSTPWTGLLATLSGLFVVVYTLRSRSADPEKRIKRFRVSAFALLVCASLVTYQAAVQWATVAFLGEPA